MIIILTLFGREENREELIKNEATIKFDKKAVDELVVTAEGVENCESSAVLSLVLHLGLPGEYFKILCYSIQIVYERNPICSNASCYATILWVEECFRCK